MKINLIQILRYTFLVFIVVLFITPILYMLLLSFVPQSIFIQQEMELSEVARSLTLLNYQVTFEKFDLTSLIIESLRQTLFSVLFVVFLSLPISYHISRLNSDKSSQYSISFLSLKFIPGIAICIPLYYLFNNIIILPNWVSLIILNIGFNIPFFIWLAVPIFSKISQELEDLSTINGLTGFNYIFLVVFPLLFFKLLGLTLLISILIWNESFYSSLFRVDTLPESIVSLVGHRGIQWGQIIALGTIITFPVLVIIAFLSMKKWVKI